MSNKPGEMRIFVRDLVLDMSIGVYDFEKLKPQPVVANISAGITQPVDGTSDKLADWVSYEALVNITKGIIADSEHIHMLETFAHRIADALLLDHRITDVQIRLEKPEIISDAASVGIELHKTR